MPYERLYPNNIAPGGTKTQAGFENDDKEIKRIYDILSKIGGLQLFGSKRQSILYGSTDNAGNPNFITGSGLSISIDGSIKPIILAFAGGFSNSQGTVDYLDGIGTAVNGAWTLPANNTCYLYVDKDANTGILSYGYTLSKDQYLPTAPSSPILDQHYFNTVEMKMYRYNGNSWEEKRRIFIASVSTGASNATISHYPLSGPLDKTASIWSLLWSEKFILSYPISGYVSPPLPLTRNGTCNSIKFFPQGTPSVATSIYVFQGQSISLSSALTAAATTAITTDVIKTAVPFYAVIDSEVVQITAISGTTITISRGQLGTAAAAHSSGSIIASTIGNVSLSVSTPITLSMAALSGAADDIFYYVVSGTGLSTMSVTIEQKWVNR